MWDLQLSKNVLEHVDKPTCMKLSWEREKKVKTETKWENCLPS